MDDVNFMPRSDVRVPIGSLWSCKEPLYVRNSPKSWGENIFSTAVMTQGETALVIAIGSHSEYPQHVWARIMTSHGHIGYLNRTHFNSGGAMERV